MRPDSLACVRTATPGTLLLGSFENASPIGGRGIFPHRGDAILIKGVYFADLRKIEGARLGKGGLGSVAIGGAVGGDEASVGGGQRLEFGRLSQRLVAEDGKYRNGLGASDHADKIDLQRSQIGRPG